MNGDTRSLGHGIHLQTSPGLNLISTHPLEIVRQALGKDFDAQYISGSLLAACHCGSGLEAQGLLQAQGFGRLMRLSTR